MKLRWNLATLQGPVREEYLDGEKYIVAPAVALVEGVHAGSGGPVYYPPHVIARNVHEHNGAPLTVEHPTRDGAPISANSPDIHERQVAGKLFAFAFDPDGAKLKQEIWIHERKGQRLMPDTLAKIRVGQKVSLSTGLWTDDDGIPGKWRGKDYQASVTAFRFDHLAVLQEGPGACSIEDGCAVNANAALDEDFMITDLDAMPTDDELIGNFVGSPRNKYGTHSSKGFKGGAAAYKRAWRVHFSQVGGGATTAAAAGPIRGTVRRCAMIAAAMKPACSLPGTDSIGARTGAKSPLPGDYPEKPSDYGLSRWAKPGDDNLTQEDVQFSCTDLKLIKSAALAEIKRRANDREAATQSSEATGNEAEMNLLKRLAQGLSRLLSHKELDEETTGNEMSHGDLHGKLQDALDRLDTPGWKHYVYEVFSDVLIYRAVGDNPSETGSTNRIVKLYQRSYKIDENEEVALTDEATEVVEQRSFVPVSTGREEPGGNKEEKTMQAKEKAVADLIACEQNRFTDEHKEWLMSLEETQLEVLRAPDPCETEQTANAEKEPETKVTTNTEDKDAGQEKELTPEEWLKTSRAPAAVQEIVQNDLARTREAKAALIAQMTADKRCPYDKATLEAKDLAELRALAAWTVREVNFQGRGGGDVSIDTRTPPAPKSAWAKEEASA